MRPTGRHTISLCTFVAYKLPQTLCTHNRLPRSARVERELGELVSSNGPKSGREDIVAFLELRELRRGRITRDGQPEHRLRARARSQI
jgi:hypothetical protein